MERFIIPTKRKDPSGRDGGFCPGIGRTIIGTVVVLSVIWPAGAATGQGRDEAPPRLWEPVEPVPGAERDAGAANDRSEPAIPPLVVAPLAIAGIVVLALVAARRRSPAGRRERSGPAPPAAVVAPRPLLPAAERRSAPLAVATPPPLVVAPAPSALPAKRCEVAVARRRNRAWFYARAPGTDIPIAASPEFVVRRWDEVRLTPEAIGALEALTDGLARLGWRFSGQAPFWFGREFVRPLDTDPPPPREPVRTERR